MMKWANVKWAVIATIGWPLFLVGMTCMGWILIASQSLPDAETHARSRMLGRPVGQAVIVGWITIWVVWALARRKRRD